MTKEEFESKLRGVLDKHNVEYVKGDDYLSFKTSCGNEVFVYFSELSASINIYKDGCIPTGYIAGFYPFYEKVFEIHDGGPKSEDLFKSVFISEGLSFFSIEVRKRG